MIHNNLRRTILRIRRLLFYVVSSGVILLLAGCPSLSLYKMRKNDPYGRYIVDKPKWTVKTDNPDPAGMIDHNCVYIWKRERDEPGKAEPVIEYEVMRLWPTGQIMAKFFDHLELDTLGEQMSTLNESTASYYIMIGHEFIEERYNRQWHTYGKGFVDKDGNIVITHLKLGGNYLKGYRKWPETIYVKTKVELKPLTPDW